jgi:hypothetical protein
MRVIALPEVIASHLQVNPDPVNLDKKFRSRQEVYDDNCFEEKILLKICYHVIALSL